MQQNITFFYKSPLGRPLQAFWEGLRLGLIRHWPARTEKLQNMKTTYNVQVCLNLRKDK